MGAAYYEYKMIVTVTIQMKAKELYKSAEVFLFAFLVVIKQYLINQADFMPPSIFQNPDFANQFPFPQEVPKIGIPL